MAVLNILEALNQTMYQQLENDKSVVIYGQDVGFEGGVFRTTAGLQKKFGEDRVFDAPISESAIVGSAVGMAINGLKPVAEIQFDGFVLPAFNQIVSHVARMRNRSRGNYSLPLVIRMPYGGGVRALEHHSEALESLFGHIPGLQVVIPSTPYDAKGLLASSIQSPNPIIFLEPKKIYRAFKQEVPEEEYFIPIGKAKTVKQGTDLTILVWGSLVREAQKAAEALEQKNISVEIIDLRTISPLDTETIITSVKKTGRVLIVHEAYKSFGPGAELISLINEEAFFYLQAPPTRLAGFDITVPLPRGEHHFIIDHKRIQYEAEKLMKVLP